LNAPTPNEPATKSWPLIFGDWDAGKKPDVPLISSLKISNISYNKGASCGFRWLCLAYGRGHVSLVSAGKNNLSPWTAHAAFRIITQTMPPYAKHLVFLALRKIIIICTLLTERPKRAKSPIRRDREIFLSSDVCMSGCQFRSRGHSFLAILMKLGTRIP